MEIHGWRSRDVTVPKDQLGNLSSLFPCFKSIPTQAVGAAGMSQAKKFQLEKEHWCYWEGLQRGLGSRTEPEGHSEGEQRGRNEIKIKKGAAANLLL